MSIVGAEAVSLSDLMKLGPEALGAMAQGQTKSIAPSYMVLAALKSLTEQKQGMAPNVPQTTVKDQVVQQAMPQQPQQMGIGAMAPQKFAEGGSVTPTFGQDVLEWMSQFGSDLGQDITDIGRGRFRKRTLDEVNYGNEGRPRGIMQAQGTQQGTSATPATRVGTEKGRATNLGKAEYTPPIAPAAQDLQPGFRVSGSASATSRSGIGGAGVPPQAKYAKDNVKAKPLSEIEGLAIPEDKYLSAAYDKFSKPDEKRMAELKEAERNAGLGALAKGILKGRGFGGAFGPAVAESFEAQETQAKERRQYEDAREKMATELGLKKGSQAREDFFKNTEFKKGERDVDLAQQKDSRDFGFQRERAISQDAIERAKLGIMAEANRISAEVRRDGLDRQKFEKLLALQQSASKVAQDYVDAMVKANPTAGIGPDSQRKLDDLRLQEYRRLFPENLEALMNQGLGLPSTQSANTGRVYRN